MHKTIMIKLCAVSPKAMMTGFPTHSRNIPLMWPTQHTNTIKRLPGIYTNIPPVWPRRNGTKMFPSAVVTAPATHNITRALQQPMPPKQLQIIMRRPLIISRPMFRQPRRLEIIGIPGIRRSRLQLMRYRRRIQHMRLPNKLVSKMRKTPLTQSINLGLQHTTTLAQPHTNLGRTVVMAAIHQKAE